MRRLFSSFARGAPGIGLLLLRVATGSLLIYQGVTALIQGTPFTPTAFDALLILLALLLLAGLWTPIVAALVALLTVWENLAHPASRPQAISIAIMAAALALLGPGAFSVDARLYGWKQIKISSHSEDSSDSP